MPKDVGGHRPAPRPTNFRARFGSNLRGFRKSQGLSQEALAERAGLHWTYVGSVERGERNISLDNIVRLATALGRDVRDLFGPPAGTPSSTPTQLTKK